MSASQEPMIRVENLTTYYGERRILDRVNLDVQAGETLVILGRSGTGKSTLLRHLIRLEPPPRSGHIYIKDRDIYATSEDEFNLVRQKIGMAFQGAALFNSMTIEDNVALPLRELTKLEDSTVRIVARMKLEQVGLSGVESYLPSQLSGGMKKRAGVARAMAMDPEILLFDEPSAGLDPITAAGIDQLILKVKQAFHMTIVVVTHEMPSAALIADKVAMMSRGKVVATGTLAEVRANPDPWVQQFLNRIPEDESRTDGSYLRELIEPLGAIEAAG
jgi:phospholipid/cholesterol/gamma-HCH transport system ATP-binding protein